MKLCILFVCITVFRAISGQLFFNPCPASPCPLKCPLKTDDKQCKTCDCPKGVSNLDKECDEKKKCSDNSYCNTLGYCTCNTDYVRGDQPGCIKIPRLGDTCLINGTRFTCTGYGVNWNCDGTKCTCFDGFEPSSENKKECKPKVRKLGDACHVDDDCTNAYAECKSGKCTCIDEFKEADGVCKPKKYNCPSGHDGYTEDDVVFCNLKDKDDCPPVKGTDTPRFCFSVSTSKDRPSGHCCPSASSLVDIDSDSTCPVGKAHPTGKCCNHESIPADGPLPKECQPYCPVATHTCQGSVCCPTPCRRNLTGFFAVNGMCYDIAGLGKPCEVDDQCATDATCRQDKDKKRKTCQCLDGYVFDDVWRVCKPLKLQAKPISTNDQIKSVPCNKGTGSKDKKTCECPERYRSDDGVTCWPNGAHRDTILLKEKPKSVSCKNGTGSTSKGGKECECPDGYFSDDTVSCLPIEEREKFQKKVEGFPEFSCGNDPQCHPEKPKSVSCKNGTGSASKGDKECECPDGYFSDDTVSCMPNEEREKFKKKLLEFSCENDTQCHAGSNCMHGECICPPGYASNGVVCQLTNALSETCKETKDCSTPSSACLKGYCTCIPGYIRDGLFCRLRQKISPSCDTEKDCPLNKFISATKSNETGNICVTGLCVCPYETVRKAKSCTRVLTDIACASNSECGIAGSCQNSKCVCKADFVRDGDNCVKKVDLDTLTSSCKTNEDCKGLLQSGICVNGKCLCKPGYTRDGRACWITTTIFESCKSVGDCATSGTDCISGKCACKSDHVRSGGLCIPIDDVPYKCKNESDCPDRYNSDTCIGGYCVCNYKRVLDGVFCQPADLVKINSELEENDCNVTADCKLKSTLCVLGSCVCKYGHVRLNGKCVKLSNDNACKSNSDCKADGTSCKDGKCKCDLVVDGDVCKSKSSIAETCKSNADCNIMDSFCKQDRCVCQLGRIKDGLGCRVRVYIKDNCTKDSDCKATNTTCLAGKCACKSNLIRDGNKCLRPDDIEEACQVFDNNHYCLSTGAVCTAGKCGCDAGYERKDGRCRQPTISVV